MSSGGLFAAAIYIPIVLDQEFAASKLTIGLIVTAYATALFLASVLIGRAADVKGRRKFLRMGFALASFALLLQIFADSPVLLLLARILLGTAVGTIQSVLVAYFIYETKGKIGKFSSFSALGWGFGSLAAGIIGDYLLVFIFSAGLMICATVAVFSLPETIEKKQFVPLFPRKIFRDNYAVYSSVLIRHIGANLVWVTYPLFLIDVLGAPPFWVGAVYATNAVTQFLVMRRLDEYNSIYLIRIGFVLSAATFLLFSITQTYLEILPLQIVLAFSWASLYVGSLKFVTERSPEKATSVGWLHGVISIAGIIGPVLGGTLNDVIGYRLTMIAAVGLSIAGFLVFIVSRRRERRTSSPTISR